jgi:hypothetical protein
MRSLLDGLLPWYIVPRDDQDNPFAKDTAEEPKEFGIDDLVQSIHDNVEKAPASAETEADPDSETDPDEGGENDGDGDGDGDGGDGEGDK